MMCSPLVLLFISSAYFSDEILVYDHELNKSKIYPRQVVGRGNETQLSVGEISNYSHTNPEWYCICSFTANE